MTGAGSGIGQALAIELARSGAKLAISDVDTEGLAATEERLKAIGAPVKADRLDVTEREAFELYADAVVEHFGKVNQIYNNAGIAFAGDVEVEPVQGHRAGDGRRLLGRRQRHQGVPAAPDRLRRRARRQRLQHLRPVLGARPGRLQLGEVRGARIHRGAAPGDGAGRSSGQGDDACIPAASRPRSPATWTAVEGIDKEELAQTFDKKLASTSPQKAARIILDGVRKNKARVLVGPDAKVLDLIVRVTGSGYQRLFSTVMSRMVPQCTDGD